MTAFPELLTVGLCVYSDAAVDSWNDPTPSWAAPVERPVYGWAPASTDETYDAGRSAVQLDMYLLGSKDALGDVKARDRIVIDAVTYDVVGALEDFTTGPFGFAPGVRVNLRRVEG